MEPIDKNWTNEDGNHVGGISTGIGYTIAWQRGPLNVEGRNGAFLLEVLESCLNQMKYFNELNPAFQCSENDEAIENLSKTIDALQTRKDRRAAEGTLGTHIGESSQGKI